MFHTEGRESMFHTENTASKIHTEDGDSTFYTEDGDSMFYTEDGASMFCTEDGDSMFCTEDGYSKLASLSAAVFKMRPSTLSQNFASLHAMSARYCIKKNVCFISQEFYFIHMQTDHPVVFS
jgi:hypothetical protein